MAAGLASATMAQVPVTPAAPGEITGWWLQMNPGAGKPSALVLVYPADDPDGAGTLLFGRLLFSLKGDGSVYDRWTAPIGRADKLAGGPPLMGTDIIYQLKPKDGEWAGRIIDPRSGDEYDSRLWREGPNLVLRGQLKGILGFLGQNQTWLPFNESTAPTLWRLILEGQESLPDPAAIRPVVPRKK
jgi:hypothetical protein